MYRGPSKKNLGKEAVASVMGKAVQSITGDKKCRSLGDERDCLVWVILVPEAFFSCEEHKKKSWMFKS